MSARDFNAGSAGGVSRRRFVQGAFGALFLGGLTPAHAIMQQAREETWVEQCRMIAMAMLSYATDNNENYPDGKSSTEVFQKLMDGRYITDPGVFLLPLPNKTQSVGGAKLKPENVCFDVSCCLDISSPDTLPLVYLTGYKVVYKAGAAAIPIAKPPPPGIAVAFKNNSTKFMRPPNATDGIIPNFIPVEFPAGKDYHQLTPDGTAAQ